MGTISAFVLAGGQSTRMGTDKAFVVLEGRTLLARALNLVSTLTSDVRILGSRTKFGAFGTVVEDEFPDHGPLAGIHAALRASISDLNLILAVDMPFVRTKFLQYLTQRASAHSATVTVPLAEGHWQPLCAVYRKSFADVAQSALREGRNKIDPLFRQVELQVLEEEDLNKQGFPSDMFRNLNTPGDVHEASRREKVL
jgi:molybdenum cofactor guanylyltransferase